MQVVAQVELEDGGLRGVCPSWLSSSVLVQLETFGERNEIWECLKRCWISLMVVVEVWSMSLCEVVEVALVALSQMSPQGSPWCPSLSSLCRP